MTAVLPTAARTGAKLLSIVEIFGPTIQGEGAEAGVATHFVRLGGCDYRCSWCDTMYAVDPKTVRDTAERLTAEQVVARVSALEGGPAWTSISGGNPALFELGDLVDGLHAEGFRVSVETQGSLWKPWLGTVDRLTVSPKPPSSGMATAAHVRQFERFMAAALDVAAERIVLKIVVFDDEDLAWARAVADRYPQAPLYLSAGTPMPAGDDVREALGERYRWLCERVAVEPSLKEARVLPQLHVVAWKGVAGV